MQDPPELLQALQPHFQETNGIFNVISAVYIALIVVGEWYEEQGNVN